MQFAISGFGDPSGGHGEAVNLLRRQVKCVEDQFTLSLLYFIISNILRKIYKLYILF